MEGILKQVKLMDNLVARKPDNQCLTKNMNQFKIGEWTKFRSEFHRLFPGVPIMDLHDGLMSLASGRLTINITAFDKGLEKMYPEDWGRMSMQDIIIKHYGPEAMQLIESVL